MCNKVRVCGKQPLSKLKTATVRVVAANSGEQRKEFSALQQQ